MQEGVNGQEHQRFKFAVQAGARQVIAHKRELNAINVFPVSDGDTGSNLASLMQTILEETGEQLASTMAVFERVADASLVGARGNSGLIMAQYFNGLYANLVVASDSSFVTKFVKSAQLAIADAYQAIEKPVEGTMITVIRSWGESLNSQKQDETLEVRLTKALSVAKTALEKTTEQLMLLQKNQVVDAGARGFYLFIEGFTQAFNNQQMQLGSVEEVPQISRHHHTSDEMSQKPINRYCTEVLLEKVSASMETIKERLKGLGDSMVVVVNRDKARIHIHSNHPAKVLTILREFGNPLQQKADDMHLQYDIRQARRSSIALVTDSIADVPADYLLAQQIHVLPMTILMGESSYLDRLTIQNTEFFSLQKQLRERGSSSQPSLSQIENLFAFLDTVYDEIIVITVSEKMSGTFQSVKRLADKHGSMARIEVLDSQLNSAAQGLLVMRVNQWIQEGRIIDEIVEKATEWREKIKILVSVDDLEPMLQSGRVPQAVGRLAQKIKLKPLVSLVQGEGKLSNFSLNLERNESKMMKKIRAYHKKNQLLRYGIVYAGAADRAEKWRGELVAEIGVEPAFVMPISTAVALSAGDGSVAVAFEIDEGVENG